MKDIVVVDRHTNTAVNCPLKGLPDYIHDAYAPEVSIKFWQDDDRLPGALHWEDAVPEGCLDQVNDPFPVPHVCIIFNSITCKDLVF